MNTKHGMSNTKIYRNYYHMISRCYDVNDISYKNYGQRGITVCEDWKNSFKSYYDWIMANGYEEYLTLDRIDNDGDYEPNNCRWVTVKEQSNNRRSNVWITINDITKTQTEWSRQTGISAKTINYRYFVLNIRDEKLFEKKEKGWNFKCHV